MLSIGEEDMSIDDAVDSISSKNIKKPDKPTVFIKNKSGEITGSMSRNIKQDSRGYFYKRFDGTRQAVKKDGNSFIFTSKI